MKSVWPIIAVVFFFFLGNATVAAQVTGFTDSLSIEVAPRVPGPQQKVVISLTSYAFDIDRSLVSWSLNGRALKAGEGERTLTFTTGNAGTTDRITFRIQTPSGGIIEQTLSFYLAAMDIMVESETYTPLFYRGRALPSYGVPLRLIALPDIAGVDPRTLVYRWERDYEFVDGASGKGKNVFVTTSPNQKYQEVYAVEATSVDGRVRLRAETVITNVDPIITLYESNQLTGPRYSRALSSLFNLTNAEVTLQAEPYFFSVGRPDDSRLLYEWSLDGSPVNLAGGSSLTLRQETSGEGTAQIKLSVQNGIELLQAAAAALLMHFGVTGS